MICHNPVSGQADVAGYSVKDFKLTMNGYVSAND